MIQWPSLEGIEVVFVITAALFNLLIAGIFIATKHTRPEIVRVCGYLFLALTFPLAVAFLYFLARGARPLILLDFGFVFLYLLVELLLDFVLKIEFRQNWSLHAPYIVLEYAALFGLIGIAFEIDPLAGYAIVVCFWLLMASLVYMYADQIRAAAAARQRSQGTRS